MFSSTKRTLDAHVVKARKSHVCLGCNRTIPKWHRLTVITHCTHDSIESDYWCETCVRFHLQKTGRPLPFVYPETPGELLKLDVRAWKRTREFVEAAPKYQHLPKIEGGYLLDALSSDKTTV